MNYQNITDQIIKSAELSKRINELSKEIHLYFDQFSYRNKPSDELLELSVELLIINTEIVATHCMNIVHKDRELNYLTKEPFQCRHKDNIITITPKNSTKAILKISNPVGYMIRNKYNQIEVQTEGYNISHSESYTLLYGSEIVLEIKHNQEIKVDTNTVNFNQL